MFRLRYGAVFCAIFAATPAFAEPVALEVMGLAPGKTTVAEARSILTPHAKSFVCKDKDGLSALQCRTKGEKKSLTLAGNEVAVAVEAPMGANDDTLITKATLTFREKGTFVKAEDARRLVSAFTAKFGPPTEREDCAPAHDATWLNDELRADRVCASWIDAQGVRLSVIYRIRQDVFQAIGGGDRPMADHFIVVEIFDPTSLISDL